MNTLQLNTLLGINIISFNLFKQLNRNSNNGIDALASSINKVYQANNTMYVEFENGKAIELHFNGGYIKYRRNGTVASKQSINKEMRLENGHIQLKIEDKTILMERFVAICYDIMNNQMPTSYSELVANVMDGSGSVITASQLGIPVNYHPNNIEWCTRPANGVHGSMIKKMQEKTGHVYRFSANDVILRIIFLNNNINTLRNYCQNNLVQIK